MKIFNWFLFSWVRLSYGVSSAYVLADTRDKAIKMGNSLEQKDPERTKKASFYIFFQNNTYMFYRMLLGLICLRIVINEVGQK